MERQKSKKKKKKLGEKKKKKKKTPRDRRHVTRNRTAIEATKKEVLSSKKEKIKKKKGKQKQKYLNPEPQRSHSAPRASHLFFLLRMSAGETAATQSGPAVTAKNTFFFTSMLIVAERWPVLGEGSTTLVSFFHFDGFAQRGSADHDDGAALSAVRRGKELVDLVLERALEEVGKCWSKDTTTLFRRPAMAR